MNIKLSCFKSQATCVLEYTLCIWQVRIWGGLFTLLSLACIGVLDWRVRRPSGVWLTPFPLCFSFVLCCLIPISLIAAHSFIEFFRMCCFPFHFVVLTCLTLPSILYSLVFFFFLISEAQVTLYMTVFLHFFKGLKFDLIGRVTDKKEERSYIPCSLPK